TKSDISMPSSRLDSAVYFVNTREGWALIKGNLYFTADAGNSWTLMNRNELASCKSVIFTSKEKGWSICDNWASKERSNSVLSTKNGGRSWFRAMELPTPIYGLTFLNDRIGYVTSRWNPIRRTSDGGKTWEE